jgi:ATP-dependent Lon protease
VRSLEREIAKLIRSKAVEYSQSLSPTSTSSSASSIGSTSDTPTSTYKPDVTAADIERILGLPKFESELREASAAPGVIHGLSYQGSGMGGVLVLEAVIVPVGSDGLSGESEKGKSAGGGHLKCTGRLGEVIQESAELALTWVKANAASLGVQGKMRGADIHVSRRDLCRRTSWNRH